MTALISIALFLVFLFLSGIHFYWGLGGKWGSQAVFPTINSDTKPIIPGKIPTFVVAFGLLAMGLFILQKANFYHFSIPSWLDQYGLWAIATIFILRAIGDFKYLGFFKKIKETAFGINDSKYYSPLCLSIGILILILILKG